MPQIDGLRAFAVGGVLLAHFLPASYRIAPWGELGVRLFFVISGFLITGILLRCRNLTDSGERTLGQVLRQFYARRCLRIFPIYYLMLGIAVLFNLGPARETFWWHAAYLSNVYTTLTGKLPGELTPYWSLAVEEQFYLVWPWVMLLVPRRWVVPVVALTIVLGPLSRIGGLLLAVEPHRVTRLPIGCLDTLGLGSLLALCSDADWLPTLRARFRTLCLAGGLPLMALALLINAIEFNHLPPLPAVLGRINTVTFDLSMGLLGVWVISGAATGFGGVVGKVLTARHALYAGSISYGLYVYHFFAMTAVQRGMVAMRPIAYWLPSVLPAVVVAAWWCAYLTFRRGSGQKRWEQLAPLLHFNSVLAVAALGFQASRYAGLPGAYADQGVTVVLSTALSLTVAGISWMVVEQPITQLKRHFEYAGPAR